MAEEAKGFTLEESATYHAESFVPAPEFNPDANESAQLEAGIHHVKVLGGKDTRFLPDNNCTWGGENFCLHQLWVKLEAIDGPHKGAQIMDFIHMPTWDAQANAFRPMAQGQENKWGNFLKALGFPVTQDNLWPAGFRLPHLAGRECWIEVTPKMDQHDKTKQALNKFGKPAWQVKMFGYHATNPTAKTAATPPAATTKATKSTPAAPTTATAPTTVPTAPATTTKPKIDL